MASGRRDYTWGFLNEAASEGRYVEFFGRFFATGITGKHTVLACTYTVPAGYRLGINRVGVASGIVPDNQVYINKNDDNIFIVFFSADYYHEFSDHNTLYFEEGETMNLYIWNNDTVTTTFNGCVSGTLEQVTL